MALARQVSRAKSGESTSSPAGSFPLGSWRVSQRVLQPSLNPAHVRQPDQSSLRCDQDAARPSAAHRVQRPGRAARGARSVAGGRRRLAGGKGLHRAREGACARPGRSRQPYPWPGGGGRGVRGTHRLDGRGQCPARSGHHAASGDPDGRPAGLGQDDDQRQAGAAAARGDAQEGVAGELRRLSSGGDRPAAHAGRAARQSTSFQ